MLTDLPEASQSILYFSLRVDRTGNAVQEVAERCARITDWETLVERAKDQRIAGLMYAALFRAGVVDRIETLAALRLRRIYEQTAAENLARLHELRRIREKAVRAGVPFVLLKGMALLATAYADIGLRPMDDMDLWVQPDDRDRFPKILIDAGFQQDPLYPDTFRRGAVIVDLHTHPLGADRIRSRRYLLRTESAKLFHRARPVNWAGTVLHCPADFDQLVLVSVHALKHGLHRLGWLSDVVHLTGQWEAAKWRLFERWCKKTGGARAVGAVFAAVETLQGGRGLLPETADRLKKPLGQKDRKLVLLREKRAHLPFFVSVWLMRPEAGIFRSAVFFFETFFPRPAVLRQSFPAFSRFPAPFLYALRILQVAAGLLGRRRSAGSGQIPQRPSS